MPLLRERLSDIPELVEHYLRLEGARGGRTCRIEASVLAALVGREWPGNVRELANEVARLLVLSGGDTIWDPSLVRPAAATATAGSAGPSASAHTLVSSPEQIRPLAELERHAIEAAVNACDGDKSLAASRLGISRAKIYQRWKEWHGEGE
jgi:DNA-binding NtrC family response regulator